MLCLELGSLAAAPAPLVLIRRRPECELGGDDGEGAATAAARCS